MQIIDNHLLDTVSAQAKEITRGFRIYKEIQDFVFSPNKIRKKAISMNNRKLKEALDNFFLKIKV
jgi:hypothetical protein